jgi:hypothetical protein
MRAALRPLIICVPRSAAPWYPSFGQLHSGDEYLDSSCDDCGIKVWLGVNSKALYDRGGFKKICAQCAFRKYQLKTIENAILASKPKH